MNFRTVSFLLIFAGLRLAGQNKTYTLQLFYDINEVSSPMHFSRIDSFFQILKRGTFNLKIYGFADFLHSDDYNLSLSQKRADAVKNYFLTRSSEPQMTILTCKGMGEKESADNNLPSGDPGQRKVVVIAEIQAPVKKIDTRAITVPGPLKEEELRLEKLNEGESFVLEGLSFQPGRHVLLKSSLPVLDTLLKTLKDHPKLKIEIQGHVCCTPDEMDAFDQDSRDKKLSSNRAREIYHYLKRNGISADRLSYKGFGHSILRMPETSAENEQMNRRVEIKVIEK